MTLRGLMACFSALLLFLSACNAEGTDKLNSNAYISGTDFQYFQVTAAGISQAHIQESEDGCFFVHDRYLYHYDRTNDQILPVCSKANCLHDKETDKEKCRECNAFLEDMTGRELSVMLYQDCIYLAYNVPTTDVSLIHPSAVYRIKCDGSNRDRLYYGATMELPMLHRGYIYYLSTAYTVGEEVESSLTLCRMNVMKHSDVQEKLVSVAGNTGYGYLRGYGNYITCFMVLNGRKWLCTYDTVNNGIFEQDVPNYPAWFDGGFFYTESFYGKPDSYPADVYCTDMDGNNKQTVIKDIPQGYTYVSDGKYFYLFSGFLSHNDPDIEDHFLVYDGQMELVDEFSVPDTNTYTMDPPIGGEKYQYLVFDDEETGEWGLYIWDKSEIETLHGKAYTQQKIVYEV